MDTKDHEKRLGQSYLTVAQAAERLGVHASTIRRWIAAGILRAYRLGPKRIAVKQSDLGRVVVPRRGDANGVSERKIPGRMTKAQQRRGLKALADARRLREKLAAKYGKSPVEGWVLLNESREERTRQLMGDAE
jgi:excisionase family DNA binding protein